MMFSSAWKLLKDTVMAFIDDEALSAAPPSPSIP